MLDELITLRDQRNQTSVIVMVIKYDYNKMLDYIYNNHIFFMITFYGKTSKIYLISSQLFYHRFYSIWHDGLC